MVHWKIVAGAATLTVVFGGLCCALYTFSGSGESEEDRRNRKYAKPKKKKKGFATWVYVMCWSLLGITAFVNIMVVGKLVGWGKVWKSVKGFGGEMVVEEWLDMVKLASNEMDVEVAGFDAAAARVRASKQELGGGAAEASGHGPENEAAVLRQGALNFKTKYEDRGGLKMPDMVDVAKNPKVEGVAKVQVAVNDNGKSNGAGAAAKPAPPPAAEIAKKQEDVAAGVINQQPAAPPQAPAAAAPAAGGGAEEGKLPCNNKPIHDQSCWLDGQEYKCTPIPGQSVISPEQPPPKVGCLGGKEAWDTCENGWFLCKPMPPLPKETFHTIFNVQSSRYFEWQVRYLYYHFRKSGQEGGITRLLSGSHVDHLVDEVPTWVAPTYPRLAQDPYVPYNKPTAIQHWLQFSGINAEWIIVTDPDTFFLRPLAKQVTGISSWVYGGDIAVMLGNGKAQVVSKGKPFGQKGYMDWVKGGPFESLAAKYCEGCPFVDALAVPIVIHIEDLKKIAPGWLSITEQIRKDKPVWDKAWLGERFALQWTAEMYGYIFAAAKLGIKHSVSDRAQEIVGFNRVVQAPILHYSLKLELPGGVKWHKYFEDAGSNIPDPPQGTNAVSTRFLKELKEAHDALPPTNKKWTTTYFQAEL